MISNKRLLLVMMLGLVALAIAGCSSGGSEEETAPAPTNTIIATTVPPAPSPTTKPSAPGPTSTSVPAEEKPVSGTGTLEVRVTEAPDPSITAVYVTTSNIEVSAAGEGWITVIDEDITFELLALEGVEAILGTAQLAAGKYTQVRLSVPQVEI